MPLRDRTEPFAYVTVTGRVRHISVPEKTLVMEGGTVIPMDDIAALAMGDGGEYRTVSGAVKNISSADRIVTMETGEIIPIDEIMSVDV